MASSAATPSPKDDGAQVTPAPVTEPAEKKDDGDDFASKAAIMTLMTTDVDRVSEFPRHLCSLVGKSLRHCFANCV